MKKQSLFKAINILLLSSLTTLTPFKSALAALNFNFSFGSTTGTITDLDNGTIVPLIVTVTSTGVAGANTGNYSYALGDASRINEQYQQQFNQQIEQLKTQIEQVKTNINQASPQEIDSMFNLQNEEAKKNAAKFTVEQKKRFFVNFTSK